MVRKRIGLIAFLLLLSVPFSQSPLFSSGQVCSFIVDQDDAFTEVTQAINVQPDGEVERVHWFTLNGVEHLVIGSQNLTGQGLNLYRFEGMPGTDSEALIQYTTGSKGFDTEFNGIGRGFCSFERGGNTYLATSGARDIRTYPGLPGLSIFDVEPLRLFKYNPIADRFDLVLGKGFDTQPLGQARDLTCIERNGKLYLVAGGIYVSPYGVLDRSLLLYEFNDYTGQFEEVVDAFDLQHDALVYSVEWHVVNGTAYLAISGNQVGTGLEPRITTRLYRFDENALQLIEIPDAFDVQPDDAGRTQSVNWVTIGGKTFLAAGSDEGDYPARYLSLYLFDQSYPERMTLLPFAVDIAPDAQIITVEFININGVVYLATGGMNAGDGIVTRVYKLDPDAETLTFQNILPAEQHGNDIESISLTRIANTYYLSIGGEIDTTSQYPPEVDAYGSNISTRLYRFNLLATPYDCIEIADLIIDKTVDNATPTSGEQITFTITVTNNGPAATNDVTVNDLLPSGLTFVSATPSQGSYNSTSGVWDVGAILSGNSATLSITAQADSVLVPTMVVNTATVADAYIPDIYGDNNSASVTVTVSPEPAPNSVQPGARLNWSVVAPGSVACTINVE